MRYGVRCINTVINKINELLTEGGRHVTIYNKYKGRNEEYVIVDFLRGVSCLGKKMDWI